MVKKGGLGDGSRDDRDLSMLALSTVTCQSAWRNVVPLSHCRGARSSSWTTKSPTMNPPRRPSWRCTPTPPRRHPWQSDKTRKPQINKPMPGCQGARVSDDGCVVHCCCKLVKLVRWRDEVNMRLSAYLIISTTFRLHLFFSVNQRPHHRAVLSTVHVNALSIH